MKKNYLIVFLCFMALLSYGQNPLISPGPGNNSVCPGIGLNYNVVPGPNYSKCGTVTWTVTNGSFAYGSSVTSKTVAITANVTVYWDDKPATGTLKATSTCKEGSISPTESYIIRSIAGIKPSNAQASAILPYCSTAGLTLRVDVLFIPNTIGFERVDGYEWKLPDGWKSNGGSGTITTTSELLYVTPEDGCSGGSVTVKAFTNCSAPRKYSESATISLERKAIAPLVAPAGYPGPRCGVISPVTFTAAAIPCAKSYTWKYPAGWRNNSAATGNFITLTPSGSNADGGDLSVDIDLGPGCKMITQKYTLIYDDPDLSKPVFSSLPGTICSGGRLTVQVDAVPGATSYEWYAETDSYFNINASEAIAWLNDIVTSSLSHVTTASNSVTLSVPAFSGSVRYNIRIFVRAGNGACAGSGYTSRDIWAGAPLQAHTSLVYIPGRRGVNPVSLSANALYNIQIDDVPGATSYRWELPDGFSFFEGFGKTGSMVKVWTSGSNGSYYVRCYPLGICGDGGTGNASLNVRIVDGTGGGGLPPCRNPPCSIGPQPESVYPNPSSNKLTVVTGILDNADAQITLYDSFQQSVYFTVTQSETVDIDVATLPNGIYYLEIKTREKTTKERVMINK
jgi:hypothetical protein